MFSNVCIKCEEVRWIILKDFLLQEKQEIGIMTYFAYIKPFFYQTNTEITDKILHFDFSNSQQQISVKKQLLLFTRFF